MMDIQKADFRWLAFWALLVCILVMLGACSYIPQGDETAELRASSYCKATDTLTTASLNLTIKSYASQYGERDTSGTLQISPEGAVNAGFVKKHNKEAVKSMWTVLWDNTRMIVIGLAGYYFGTGGA